MFVFIYNADFMSKKNNQKTKTLNNEPLDQQSQHSSLKNHDTLTMLLLLLDFTARSIQGCEEDRRE